MPTTAFLPWLQLEKPLSVGRVTFVPLEPSGRAAVSELQEVEQSLANILSGFVDVHGKAIDACTVVTHSARNPHWDVEPSEDWEEVELARLLLSLAAISANDYYSSLGHYSNTSVFQIFWQRFTVPAHWLSLQIRRRDGYTTDGAYVHGEIKYTMPIQAANREPAFDEGLLTALNAALTADDREVLRRLRPALSFFHLANTDARDMDESGDTILMAAAFEQLFGAESALDLSRKFGAVFGRFGNRTVKQAIKERPGITLAEEYAQQQANWFVHRKWIEELHQLRSAYVHGSPLTSRQWGWAPIEHLVVAAFVFPLVVRLLLEAEGFYTLNREDQARCRAVNRLLAIARWGTKARVGSMESTLWDKIMHDARTRSTMGIPDDYRADEYL